MNLTHQTPEVTPDSLFDGEIICYQNRKGYRFSIDAVLLAHFSRNWKKATILDLGCGNGILGLLLLYRNGGNIHAIEGIEIQQSLVKLAQRNSSENNFAQKLIIRQGDYRDIDNYYPAEYFSHIICNPPFYKIGTGRHSHNQEAFQARHQETATLKNIVKSIAYSLRNRGRISLVYPASLLTDVIGHFLEKKIQPKRVRFVYSYPESEEANLVLIECVKNGGEGLQVLPPLYIYEQKNGDYTQETAEMYKP